MKPIVYFSLFLTLLLVSSCHRPVALGSRTSRDQPGLGLAATFNKSNDEVGAAKDGRFSEESAVVSFVPKSQAVSRFVRLSRDEDAWLVDCLK